MNNNKEETYYRRCIDMIYTYSSPYLRLGTRNCPKEDDGYTTDMYDRIDNILKYKSGSTNRKVGPTHKEVGIRYYKSNIVFTNNTCK